MIFVFILGTYSEAELKIERLKHEEYIYTTDTDEIEQENIENINNQNTNKHEDLPIRDMKGKLSKRKSSSSKNKLNILFCYTLYHLYILHSYVKIIFRYDI